MRWAALTGVVTACLMVTVGSSASTPGPRYLVSAARLPGYSGIVELLGPKGGVQRVLSRNSGGWPAASWSPNGTMVAWVDRQGLKIAHADGSGVRLLVRASRTCSTICVPMTFAWSPTGRQLLVGGAGPQTGRLLTVAARAGTQTDLVHPRPYTEYRVLGWSPNGRLIAYTRSSARYQQLLELLVARTNGRGARRMHKFDDPRHDTPYGSWSPDSRSIAFTSDGRDRGDPAFGIVDVATGRLRRITTVHPLIVPPAWSPDSRRLAVIGAQVLTLDPTGHNLRRLGTTHGALVVWTRSGKLFVVRGEHDNQVFVSRDGRERPRLIFRLKKQAILALDPRS